MINGTAIGSSNAAASLTTGLIHHRFTEASRRGQIAAGASPAPRAAGHPYLSYFQPSISVK
jgi:hypothetical protein